MHQRTFTMKVASAWLFGQWYMYIKQANPQSFTTVIMTSISPLNKAWGEGQDPAHDNVHCS